jgi:hypothetical protein
VLDDGRAVAPDEAEPLRWPAVCLDWRDADAYVAWLNAKVKAAATSSLRNVRAPIDCPVKRNGNIAARAGTTTAQMVGQCHRHGQCELQRLRQPLGRSAILSTVDKFRPNPFGLYDDFGQCLAVDRRLLAQKLCRRADKRFSLDGKRLREIRAARRFMGQRADFHTLRRHAPARSPMAASIDYSSLASFRVARDLP